MKATARAPSNIALVKYWGKRDPSLNLPATGSISVTLEGLSTTTTVERIDGLDRDEIRIGGRSDDGSTARVRGFLDLVRQRYGRRGHCRIDSANDFPTGAGLASSASGFAALAVALDRVFELDLDGEQLSALARRGSGSAARSLVDGFAEMRPGTRADGADAYAVAIGPPDLLPLEIVIALVTRAPKSVGSTEGMTRTRETSPFHDAWVARTQADLFAMRGALLAGDLPRVGHLAEGNALCMHATMLGADPPLLYWLPATIGVLREVAALRADGLGAWATIDAGPQVKVLCRSSDAADVERRVAGVPGVEATRRARPGAGARIVEATD